MKLTKAGIYKASNVTFDPELIAAHSYDWWQFVRVIKGKVIFNKYPYSPTTRRHQGKVSRLLSELGIKVDKYVETIESLNKFDKLIDLELACKEQEIVYAKNAIEKLNRKIKSKQKGGY